MRLLALLSLGWLAAWPGFAAEAPPPARCSLAGTVTNQGGVPIARGGVVKIYRQGFEALAGIGDQSSGLGKYAFGEVPCGAFRIRADVPGYAPTIRDISGSPGGQFDIAVYPMAADESWRVYVASVALVVLFALSLLFVRWHNIALVDQKILAAEADITRLSIHLETPEPPRQMLLDELDKIVAPFRNRANLFDILFWTRGEELAAWGKLRDLQRQVVLTWDSRMTERIRVRLSSVEQQLRTFTDPGAIAIADQIRESLRSQTPEADRWKQLLAVGMGAINSRREEGFLVLTTWQTKGTWLAVAGLVMIAASAWVRPAWAILFLVGGVGGLLSRLARALRSEQTPSDYGASWTTLFLAPVTGALAGYFGFLLALGFVGLNVLNSNIGTMLTCDAGAKGCVSGGDSLSWTAWALAFLLGFSERFFERLVTTVDQAVIPGGSPIGPAKGGAAPASGPVLSTPSPSAPAAPAGPTEPAAMPAGVAGPRIDHATVRTIQPPGKTEKETRLLLMGVGLTEADVPPANITIQSGQQAAVSFDAKAVQYERGIVTIPIPGKLAPGDYTVRARTASGKELTATVTVA